MADVLDINTDAGDFGVGDEGDQSSVLLLKKKVLHRKGRGFKDTKLKEQYQDSNATQLVDSGPMKSVEGWILFVTSMHDEATEEDLMEKFSEFGPIISVTINLDRRTGFLKGYALIEFEKFEGADAARQALHGTEILGQQIEVNWCFVKASYKKNKRNKRKKH